MTFTVAGTSQGPDGQIKIRFANDYVGRFKQLLRKGHNRVNLIELGDAYTKAEIVQVLMTHPQFESEEDQTAIYEYAVRNAPELAKQLMEVA